jgi:hypothetical protein
MLLVCEDDVARSPVPEESKGSWRVVTHGEGLRPGDGGVKHVYHGSNLQDVHQINEQETVGSRQNMAGLPNPCTWGPAIAKT